VYGGVANAVIKDRRSEGMMHVELQLSQEQMDMLITSMEYTRMKFDKYQRYPNYEFKLQRVKEAEDVLTLLRDARTRAKWVESEIA
jgi:hypothetical protein